MTTPPQPPPLTGLRVLELAGLAPGPFAGLLLADHGATVLRIDKPSSSSPTDLLTRHKSAIAVDLQSQGGHALITKLIPHIDILIDPFRPNVLEKLNLGPEVLLALNPKLIIGRLTGFRRDGRYSAMAGHDINYLAVSGTLSLLGSKTHPLPPVNLLGDFAGGGAMLFQGILLALLARQRTGLGQTVEANMVDGSAYLTTLTRLAINTPLFNRARGENLLDGGCPWYDTYATQDGRSVAVGALEDRFFAVLIKGLGLEGRGLEGSRYDRETWPAMRRLFERTFASRDRRDWEGVFDGTDACVTPVLDLPELKSDPRREGRQRLPVALGYTPGLAIARDQRESAGVAGQGQGVVGVGWTQSPLIPYPAGDGNGARELVEEWLGNGDFEVGVGDGGMLVLGRGSKL